MNINTLFFSIALSLFYSMIFFYVSLEKREQFDRGIDPLDPESGRHNQEGFNPFQQFHQFHGSPFTFKFNFN